ncbi:MAG: dksA [Frankiales bacterium]|nr:dksA [Frankiales bacterium]
MEPLLTARADALARVAALTAQHAEILASSEGSNADDEHDPEGATIAFERQQVLALLAQARASLTEVDAALSRACSGDYGKCASCGGEIGAERLEARPSATLCIACARGQARSH